MTKYQKKTEKIKVFQLEKDEVHLWFMKQTGVRSVRKHIS